MDLRDYVRVLRKSWPLLVLCVALALSAAAVATWRSTKLYAASVTMIVSSPDATNSATAAYQGNLLSQQRVKSYADLLASERVAADVVGQLRLDESPAALRGQISASAVPDTVLLRATVTDRSPQRAQQLADAVGASFSRAIADIERPAQGKAPSVRVSVWERAKLPGAPVSPKPTRNLALGFALGLLVGVGGAVLRAKLDTSVKNADDVTDATTLPVLGAIAFDSEGRKRPLIVHARSHSARSEAFRQLRTNLQFVDVDAHPRSVVITSSLPREGKTTTSCNLAITLAQAGVTVALVEGDLRRPSFGEYLGIEGAVGLTSVLIGAASLDDALQPWGDGSLRVLASGPTPPNPSELLGSRAMEEVLQSLEHSFDLVIVDAPPLLPVTDGAVLAALTDGAIVVARVGRTRREQLKRAVEALRTVDARLLGVVLNMVPTRGPDSYHYYGYAYSYRPDGTRRGVRRTAAALPGGSSVAYAGNGSGPAAVPSNAAAPSNGAGRPGDEAAHDRTDLFASGEHGR